MPTLPNPRWELFAQGLADGKTPGKAYAAAGFGKSSSKPYQLARDKRIVTRVDELMRGRDAINQQALQLAVKETGVSKAWILGMLKENVERAMGTKPVLDKDGAPTGYYEWNGHVANKGLELLGREIGMFVERHELTLAQKLADMPEDQRATEMFELVERAKVRLAAIRAVERQTIEGSATEVSASDVEDDEPPKE
jgi:phage terminase small subunit